MRIWMKKLVATVSIVTLKHGEQRRMSLTSSAYGNPLDEVGTAIIQSNQMYCDSFNSCYCSFIVYSVLKFKKYV